MRTRLLRILPVLGCASVLGCMAAPVASADTTLAGDGTAENVSASGGALVWSRKVADQDFRLVQLAGGVTRDVAVGRSRHAFDADLGPGAGGGIVAVYSRCRPGCDVYEVNLASGRERRVAAASTRRCSETAPSIWGSTLVFVRDGGRACKPGLYVRRPRRDPERILKSVATATEAGPEISVTETDVRRTTVVAVSGEYEGGSSSLSKVLLWRAARSSVKPCEIQSEGSGGIFGIHSLESPVIDGSRLYWVRTSFTDPPAFRRAAASCGAAVENAPREAASFGRLGVDRGTIYYTSPGRGVLRADEPPPFP